MNLKSEKTPQLDENSVTNADWDLVTGSSISKKNIYQLKAKSQNQNYQDT